MSIVTEAFNDAYDTLYSEDGWKEEKKNDEGDIVMSKKSKKGQSSTSNMGWPTLSKNFTYLHLFLKVCSPLSALLSKF